MTAVAKAFFQTAIDKGIYRQMDAKLGSKVFLGLFAIADFSDHTLIDPNASHQEMQKMADSGYLS